MTKSKLTVFLNSSPYSSSLNFALQNLLARPVSCRAIRLRQGFGGQVPLIIPNVIDGCKDKDFGRPACPPLPAGLPASGGQAGLAGEDRC